MGIGVCFETHEVDSEQQQQSAERFARRAAQVESELAPQLPQSGFHSLASVVVLLLVIEFLVTFRLSFRKIVFEARWHLELLMHDEQLREAS